MSFNVFVRCNAFFSNNDMNRSPEYACLNIIKLQNSNPTRTGAGQINFRFIYGHTPRQRRYVYKLYHTDRGFTSTQLSTFQTSFNLMTRMLAFCKIVSAEFPYLYKIVKLYRDNFTLNQLIGLLAAHIARTDTKQKYIYANCMQIYAKWVAIRVHVH